jgi:hypothetical protein
MTSVDGFSVTLRRKSCSHAGNVLTQSWNVLHVVGCGVTSMGLFEVGGSEHRTSVAVSRSTVTGIASMSGRVSANVLLFETARKRRAYMIWAGRYFQEDLVPVVAVEDTC